MCLVVGQNWHLHVFNLTMHTYVVIYNIVELDDFIEGGSARAW